MIAVDTNVLARFYCDDPADPEARLQRPRARRLLLESPALFVPLTVVLELEWVMRGFYETAPRDFCRVVDHLLGMGHVTVEHEGAVREAARLHLAGLDFADALHWACSAGCSALATFDDKKFARRAARLGLTPAVQVLRG